MHGQYLGHVLDGNYHDDATNKIVYLFRDEMQHAKDTGKLDERVWQMLDDVAWEWLLDTQNIEGANNKIKQHVKKSPFISWAALSDFLVSTSICRGMPKQDQEALVDICVQVHSLAMDTGATPSYSDRCTFLTGNNNDNNDDGDGEEEAEDKPDYTASVTAIPTTIPKKPKTKVSLSKVDLKAVALVKLLRKSSGYGVSEKSSSAAAKALAIRVRDPSDPDVSDDIRRQVWLPVHWFRFEVWCVRMSISEDNTGVTQVTQVLRIEARMEGGGRRDG